jgi:hypothetical protein
MAPIKEHSAFCATCPSPEIVAHLLEPFGLTLTYTRPAETVQEYLHLPPLPAQYHFEDDWGTQVVFLAGTDTPLLADDESDEEKDGELRVDYPPHASRFWLIPGANQLSTHRVQEALAACLGFRWNVDEPTTFIERAA